MMRCNHSLFTCAAAVLLSGLCPILAAGEASRASRPLKGVGTGVRAVITQAVDRERAGRGLEAAQLYEKAAEQDPGLAPAIAPRLAQLHARNGDLDASLRWARQVAARHPDPQSYLAGIYALAGYYTDAAALLRKELAGESSVSRRIAVHLQLADVYERQGEDAEAGVELRSAAALARGRQEATVIERRIESLRNRNEGAAATAAGNL